MGVVGAVAELRHGLVVLVPPEGEVFQLEHGGVGEPDGHEPRAGWRGGGEGLNVSGAEAVVEVPAEVGGEFS